MALSVSGSMDILRGVIDADFSSVLSASTDRTLLLGELPR